MNEIRSHTKGGIILALLIITLRGFIALQIGWTMLPVLFMTMIIITRLSPPIAALTLLYGWVLFGQMDFLGFWLIPRIPTITALTIWAIFWIYHWRRVDGSLKRLDRPIVINHVIFLLLFFLIGILGALNSGYLSNPLVRFYNWDVLRAWLSFLVIGMLGCRNLKDLKVMLVGLPVAFLIYPLSLPLEAWQTFFGYGLFSSEVHSIGLGYGSLNTNTLGQAAAIAGVIAATVVCTSRRLQLRASMLLLFLTATIIVLMTGSRQALLGLLIGLLVIAILLGNRKTISRFAAFGIFIYVGSRIVLSLLPQGSGLQIRLSEIVQPPETWDSQSFATRQQDFQEVFARWMESPFFGVGFGGQRFEEIASTEVMTEEESSWINFTLRGTHNLFLAILVQTGLVGMILFLIFSLNILWNFFKALRYPPDPDHLFSRLIRVAVFASLSCFFLVQNISGGLGVSSSFLIFLLGAILGVLGSTRAYAPYEDKSFKGEKIQLAHEG